MLLHRIPRAVRRFIWRIRHFCAYVIAIFAFGFLFWTMPSGSFHDANVQFEGPLLAAKDSLTTALESDYAALNKPDKTDAFDSAAGSQLLLNAEITASSILSSADRMYRVIADLHLASLP